MLTPFGGWLAGYSMHQPFCLDFDGFVGFQVRLFVVAVVFGIVVFRRTH